MTIRDLINMLEEIAKRDGDDVPVLRAHYHNGSRDRLSDYSGPEIDLAVPCTNVFSRADWKVPLHRSEHDRAIDALIINP